MVKFIPVSVFLIKKLLNFAFRKHGSVAFLNKEF